MIQGVVNAAYEAIVAFPCEALLGRPRTSRPWWTPATAAS